jgi:hypothetical protein
MMSTGHLTLEFHTSFTGDPEGDNPSLKGKLLDCKSFFPSACTSVTCS